MIRARQDFLKEAERRWRELDLLLPSGRSLHQVPASQVSRIASLYRSLCGDLLRARSLGCPPDLLAQLDTLAARTHNMLYAASPSRLSGSLRLLVQGFPRAVRDSRLFILVAAVAFVLPLAGSLVATVMDPSFAYKVLPPEMLEELTSSYSEGFAGGRAAGSDSSMAGFYVYNNVGIAFRCFATGILFGLGSLFFLIYNGLVIGAVFGYVTSHGAGHNILIFCIGHAPLELTAIVISGAAGLRMGYALIETKGRTRIGSLRADASTLVALVLGAAAMLLLAALVEGFWSPSGVPAPFKFAFAGFMSLLVLAFLTSASFTQKRKAAVAPERDRPQ